MQIRLHRSLSLRLCAFYERHDFSRRCQSVIIISHLLLAGNETSVKCSSCSETALFLQKIQEISVSEKSENETKTAIVKTELI